MRELWTHDPKIKLEGQTLLTCRGVTYFRDANAPAGSACAARIFMGTQDARLLSLDAATGKPCAGFGVGGEVDLASGRGEFKPGEYGVSSPPVIVGRNLIIGGRVADNVRLDIPAGLIRAFDVDTGALVWAWNPVPPGRPEKVATEAGEVYVSGTTNSWTVMSADTERGLVYVPTGNTSPDFFGGLRDGLDYYSSSVVALDAATGQVVWHFQTVHHDIWDYDVPAQPVLFDLPTPAGNVPALAQPTKQGHLFVLNRVTGEPLFPVEERPVPQTVVAGEMPAPTQPFPVDEAFLLRPDRVTEDDMWGFTPWDRGKCREQFRELRYEGIFTPPSLEGTLQLPSFMGAMNWGSAAIDEARGVLVVNRNNVATTVRLIPREDADARMAKGEFMIPALKTPYAVQMEPMLSPLGAPCNRPPWGALVAIDLKSRKRLWEVPLGTTRDLAPFPLLARARRAEPRRPGDHGLRARVHRRRHRQLPARLRPAKRQGAVEGPVAGRSAGDADDLSRAAGRPAVRRDRRGRPQVSRHDAGRRGGRLRAAGVTHRADARGALAAPVRVPSRLSSRGRGCSRSRTRAAPRYARHRRSARSRAPRCSSSAGRRRPAGS